MLDIVDLQLWYDLAISTNQTSMKIRDFDKTVHSLSVGEVKKMLKELKINFKTLRHKKWSLQKEAKVATKLLELKGIGVNNEALNKPV